MITLKLKLPRAARKWFSELARTLGKRKLAAIGCALAAAAIFAIVSHPAVVGVSATTRSLPVYSVERDNKAVSLTFDAAWGNEDTEHLISILGKYNVKATFFVVGAWAERYPESVKALSDAGHEVMNHSDDHAHFTKLSSGEIITNIKEANAKISAACGVTPTLFRAPYGEYDDNVINTVSSIGMTTVQWDVDSLDWKDLSADEITKRVTGKASPGSIVLFHNAAKHTPEALPRIIEFFLREGYAIVPVSELLLDGAYTIDHTGRMRK
ncbi:MAG: polysaccharide deacetylase family protein [Oscillospiraceae bacterium]|jgi:polysaccharide deacetylase family sporulation protein PdaB|nr:polysaccharide deacetylase family protein [Oscillospiraceae bacterium]